MNYLLIPGQKTSDIKDNPDQNTGGAVDICLGDLSPTDLCNLLLNMVIPFPPLTHIVT